MKPFKVLKYFIISLAALTIFLFVLAYPLGVKINFTRSMPLGLYTSFNQDNDFKKGDLIFFDNKDLFKYFKRIVATEGDHVSVNFLGVSINGKYIKNSRIHSFSSELRPLHTCYLNKILLKNEYFVMGEAENSYDSRYFCTINKSNNIEKVRPLLIF